MIRSNLCEWHDRKSTESRNRPWMLTMAGLCGCALLLGMELPAAAEQPVTRRSVQREVCNADPICKEHAQNALNALNADDKPRAIKEFSLAYERITYPIFLFQIARLYHEQSQTQLAINHYERYITSGDDPALIDKSRQYLAELRSVQVPPPPTSTNSTRMIAEKESGPHLPLYRRWWLWTTVGVAAAGIIVTGVIVGTWPRVPTGSPTITVRE